MKTLNELREKKLEGYKGLIFKEDLKKETVKWIKEDLKFLKSLSNEPAEIIIDNWMKRLNLTEGDLK